MRWVSKFYDTKAVLRNLRLILLTMVIGKVTGGLALLAVPILFVTSITGKRPLRLVLWVLLFLLMCHGNPRIFPASTAAGLSIRMALILLAVLLMGSLSAGLSRKDGRLLSPFLGMLAFILWAFVGSLQGWQPIISILKIILFVIIYIGLLGAASFVNLSKAVTQRQVRSVLLAIFALVVIGSVLLIPFGIGMMSGREALRAGGGLFMGITRQSQVLGAEVGIVGTFIFADLVFSIKKWDRFYVLLLLCCPLLIYRSGCRTGMGTLIAGWGLVVFLAMQARGLGAAWKGRLVNLALIVVVLLGVAIAAVPSVRDKTIRYVVKQQGEGEAVLTAEAALASRQAGVEYALANFRKSPLFGNGFQVMERMAGEKREGLQSYLSAPIEKGVWFAAVLEETGIVGMLILCIWILVLFLTLVRLRAYIGLCVFWAFLTSNLGEFTMFALSYAGGFYWALIFLGVSMDVLREREAREARQMAMGMDVWMRRGW